MHYPVQSHTSALETPVYFLNHTVDLPVECVPRLTLYYLFPIHIITIIIVLSMILYPTINVIELIEDGVLLL